MKHPLFFIIHHSSFIISQGLALAINRLAYIFTFDRRRKMAKGKNKKAQKLRWRKKKANHGKAPCSSR